MQVETQGKGKCYKLHTYWARLHVSNAAAVSGEWSMVLFVTVFQVHPDRVRTALAISLWIDVAKLSGKEGHGKIRRRMRPTSPGGLNFMHY